MVVLAIVGVIAGYAFGMLLDVWDWTTFYRGSATFGFVPSAPASELVRRFGTFYLVTSLVYDSFRAAGNAILVLVLGAPVIAALARLRSRFTVTVLSDSAV